MATVECSECCAKCSEPKDASGAVVSWVSTGLLLCFVAGILGWEWGKNRKRNAWIAVLVTAILWGLLVYRACARMAANT